MCISANISMSRNPGCDKSLNSEQYKKTEFNHKNN